MNFLASLLYSKLNVVGKKAASPGGVLWKWSINDSGFFTVESSRKVSITISMTSL